MGGQLLHLSESGQLTVGSDEQEDPWNSIGAGFLTGGFLQLRTGPRSALQSAVFGGVLLVRHFLFSPPKSSSLAHVSLCHTIWRVFIPCSAC